MPAEEPTIGGVIAAAARPGHAHVKAVLGGASAWLVARAGDHGLHISGFGHTIDTSSIRHINDHHGDPEKERRRGHIAISHADLKSIPALLAGPDKVIFGARNNRRQPLIAYIQRRADGVVLYIEETRVGRKELATASMRKYPATIDADRLAVNFDLYGRTDGGDEVYIVDVPENVTAIVATAGREPATIDAVSSADPDGRSDDETPGDATRTGRNGATVAAKLRRYVPPLLGLLLLGFVIFALHRELKKIGLHDIALALAATPRSQFHHALEFLAAAFGLMSIYDIPGILFAKRRFDFPRIGLRRIALASSSAYALSHVLGAPALSGAAIRLRLYAQWGVPPAGIGRIIALSGSMFALGTATLLGGILLLAPADMPLFGQNLPIPALRAAGAALWAVVLGYILAAGGKAPLTIFRRNIPRPGRPLAIAQVALSCADTATACAILYTVLPTSPGLTYPHVLGIYLAGFAGGLVSGLPGGVGVFDTVLLLGLGGIVAPADAIGAILIFRVLYYLLPAVLAGIAFAGHEIWSTARVGRGRNK